MNIWPQVADNTLVNLVPMLTGRFLEDYIQNVTKLTTFDNITFLWDQFSDRGYRTLLMEDRVGDSFNWDNAGRYYVVSLNSKFMNAIFQKNCTALWLLLKFINSYFRNCHASLLLSLDCRVKKKKLFDPSQQIIFSINYQ